MTRVIVVGSGIAALSFVRHIKDDIEVICITKDKLSINNSNYAQGGICFSKNENDHGKSHCTDTYVAGAEMGDMHVIEQVIQKSYPLIQELIDEGVPFDCLPNTKDLNYGMEGAHSIARIIHAGGDQTGHFIAKHMASHLSHPHLRILEETEVIHLNKNTKNEVSSVLVINQNDQLQEIEADCVVIATGGINNLFPTNSNIPPSIASGCLLALQSGLALESMEMIQFHPTLLGEKSHAYSLVSEAVRGDGAVLVNENNEPFMEHVHPLKSLAPRDITSRAIYHQQKLGHQCFLDISNVEHFENRFPTISHAVRTHYENAVKTLRIPVTPGAHYTVGGIKADVDGSTSLSNVYAIGEAACTNFHGANRLASNSLLEGLVMGALCADRVNQTILPIEHTHQSEIFCIPNISTKTALKLQQQSFDILGVERNGQAMQQYLKTIENVLTHAESTHHITKQIWQNYTIVKTLQLVCTAALTRTESRGVHYRLDYPNSDSTLKHCVTEIISGGNEHVKSTISERENHTILH